MKYFEIVKLKETPIICNIPHSSIEIPPEFKKDFSLSQRELKLEIKRLADLYIDSFFSNLLNDHGGIISKVSRIVVDTERFSDDEKEPMSKVGMGAIYIKNEAGETIREIDEARKQKLLTQIYQPYHQALTKLTNDCLLQFNKCLILDCHSFPSEPRSYESDRNKDRPDICLGTDEFHTSEELKNIFFENFKLADFSIKINSPFVETMVPEKFYQKNKNVSSIMIEINRKLYMDESTFTKNNVFDEVSDKICMIIKESVESF
ncbi:MAG: hypothetical protein A2Y98_01285 [Candidatus Portnoybacteria bacterium RBG_19FT_COMBO_36_7]|uniref:N-formylglutamate amidohydrolase n=1 Tax=Candidatus Portnoybacteria bacterium RBG_19FT_COMBO_36_7 TaxID=1801992 RepID=A0A1G2F7E8_9BACT|nr:MAG: hypothetical protein A2Y98_01285 [Candidatus Portnoybacteria bacterium RBG_19FT_COMBO_36_7]